MSTFEANRERTVRSIELRLRGLSITNAQADRIRRAVWLSALTATDALPPVDSNHEAPGPEPGGSASSPRGHQPGRDAARIREDPALLGDGAEPCPSPGRHQQPTEIP